MTHHALKEAAEAATYDLTKRLEEIKTEHLRLATWNRGRDRPARVAFHHDAASSLHRALALLADLDRVTKERDEARAERDELAANASECVEVLALMEHPAFPDSAYHAEVKALGERIGFGALMSTASAGWREVLGARGSPLGSEHVSGPSFGTVIRALTQTRALLSRIGAER